MHGFDRMVEAVNEDNPAGISIRYGVFRELAQFVRKFVSAKGVKAGGPEGALKEVLEIMISYSEPESEFGLLWSPFVRIKSNRTIHLKNPTKV